MNRHLGYTQADRVIAVETVLGRDALLLERVEVREGLNSLFEIRASVRAQQADHERVAGTLVFARWRRAGASRPRTSPTLMSCTSRR